MYKQITFKIKNKLLVFISVLFFIIIYFVSIKRTISAYNEYEKNVERFEIASNAPLVVSQLQTELDEINSKLVFQNSEGDHKSEKLIELITNYCQNSDAILKEFPETEIAQKDDLLIETNKFTLAGDFITLLKFVYLLEQKNRLGKITSVNYLTKKDFKSNRNALTVTIYLQNIKKQNNEK
ncbi:MAG: hypothetical protein J0L87_05980 [Bacteroidetes bacterium]|nr:hypothetical protein [Bacteroidota bacterium]